MMVEVVKSGTGRKAQIGGTTVAGKTGTAQNEKSRLGEGYDHAWFIGFAPAANPQIAVSVILEYQGKGGGQAAAPIARQVMAQWLNSQLLKNKK
jgi:peptidoglycan glycosyltransferase